MKHLRVISVGFAIFAMLFGAGNIVFPLDLGRIVGNQVLFALLGLGISAIVVPIIGLISSMLFEGNYTKFLGTMGRLPGALITFICMILLGPFCSIPRCISLAHAVVRWYVPEFSTFAFSFIAIALIFICTMKRSFVVDLLGRFLGPIKLILLLTIMVIGFLHPIPLQSTGFTAGKSFLLGLHEGFWMLDLLGTIFFSGLILRTMKKKAAQDEDENLSTRDIILIGLQGGILGGVLLGFVYAGYCVIAAMYGPQLVDVAQDQILSILAISILGSRAAILANITVAVSCLTTALALTTVFADYVCNQIFGGNIRYFYALLITSVCTFIMANLGFAGIMKIISPVITLCYPSLAVLAIANVVHKLFGFDRHIKPLVFATFILTVILDRCF